MKSIYDELGGDEVLEKATATLFERALADPLLQLYLSEADVPKISQAFKRYVAAMLGASEPYTGKTLAAAHKGTQINDLAFDSFVEMFLVIFKELGVRDEVVAKVKAKLSPLKNDVVDSFHWTGRHFYAPDSKRS